MPGLAEGDQAVWYYRLGERTLGPVPWSEIEALTEDTVDAAELLVARGGDAKWRPAREILDARAEAEATAEPEAPPAGDAERLASKRTAAGGWVGEPGLIRWIVQAWEMLSEDYWPWVGACLLWTAIATVSLGILAGPMTIGLYMMALRRFDGERVGASDIFAGFERFWSAIGLNALSAAAMLVAAAPLLVPGVVLLQKGLDPVVISILSSGMALLVPLALVAMAAVQTWLLFARPLVAEGEGAWAAARLSYETVGGQFWSYLGVFVVFLLIASFGTTLLNVGVLFTWPFLPCAAVAAYRWHVRPRLDARPSLREAD